MLLLDGVEQLQAIELAALQPDIQKDQVWTPRRDRSKRIIAVARGPRAVALILQNTRHQVADISLIVDYQNFGGHHVTRARSWTFSVPADSALLAAANRT